VLLGELAALATSFLFSTTSTFFTFAGRKVGSVIVNRTRLVLAVLLLIGAHLLLRTPLPIHAGGERLFWLGISGILGLVMGDAFLFQAFIWIGPRLSMLLMSLSPIIASLAAWLFLEEMLSPGQVTGIVVTLVGISLVIADRNQRVELEGLDRRTNYLGILFGLGAAAGQALGLITAKKGLVGDFPALSGTLVRMSFAALTLWGFTLLRGQARATLQKLAENRKTLWLILGGAFTGPTLGVTFSLFAIQRTEIGIASTLMSLPPIILLPVGYFLFKERFGWVAIAGTFVAIVGVALLFLV
jgi:drug/metabolite transporter (DMT)-like permease